MVAPILPMTMSQAVLRRGGHRILGPVTLTLQGRGITIVLGPNGAGKTSLLRAMHGLDRLRSGSVSWAVPTEAARKRQAFVFQTPILMRRSVRDCIAFPLTLAGHSRRDARQQASAMAERVGLAGHLDQPAQSLSGGERQKMAIARALVCAPQVLFLDEPCANLDGRSTAEIEAILLAAREGGTRIVMATHNVGQARRLADDVLFVHRGLLHESGPAAGFFSNPQTPEARAHLQGDLLS